MQRKSLTYLHLPPDGELPQIDALAPFLAVVLVETEVVQIWQWEVSRWLVESGCRYMQAWGHECSTWDDAVDEANLERFNYDDIPDEEAVVTTFHDDEDMEEVFWFAKNRATHPIHTLNNVVILHIAAEPNKEAIEEQYADA
ncbi:MAG: hypothetical protein ACLGI6_18580 [Gammaproteobacteria bacterium]